MRQTQVHESDPLWKASAEPGAQARESEPTARRAEPVPAGPMDALPEAHEARSLRQAAVLHMQRHHGNAFVQRQMGEEPAPVEEQAPAEPTATESQAPTGSEAPAESDPGLQAPGTSAGNQIGGDGSSVRADGGGVTIDGGQLTVSTGMVNLNSAVVTTSGVLRAPTLIADTVVATAYTPGVGNVQ